MEDPQYIQTVRYAGVSGTGVTILHNGVEFRFEPGEDVPVPDELADSLALRKDFGYAPQPVVVEDQSESVLRVLTFNEGE